LASTAAQPAARPAARSGFRPSFHFALVLILCGFVFGGFAITYFVPMATGTRPPDSPIVHLHGAAWFSWMLLLLVQAVLINGRKVKWHRSLGTFGIAVATFAALTGIFIMFAAASTTQLGGVGPAVFWLNVTAPPSFALIFALGIRAAKKPHIHRGLMLMATISIIMPGMNRVYMQGLGIEHFTFIETYLTMDAMVAAILWHEWRTMGRVSRMSWIGAGIVVVPQLLIYPVSSQPWWREFIFWLGSLAHYE
jgi:hypothetical protein